MEPHRIYLAGRLTLEGPDAGVGLQDLPSRQARLALAYLAVGGLRPVARAELADAVWGEQAPSGWDGALSALVSKLRPILARCGMGIDGRGGAYHVTPSTAWVDVEAARSALDEAEGALRREDAAAAWGAANVACSIADRPLLPGDEAPWLDEERGRLRLVAVRGKECLAEVSLERGEYEAAAQYASDAIVLEPYRETAHLRLMRALGAMGNTAEALRVYDRLRRMLADELGADPSPPVQAYHVELLNG
jgi:DNA-binding SARP family transcriptional activator